jgi:hypothetical protein
VTVRLGHDVRQGNAPRVGQEGALRTQLASVGGVRTSGASSEGRLSERSVKGPPGARDTHFLIVGEEDLPPQLREWSLSSPRPGSVVERALGSEAKGDGAPLAAGAEEVPDRIEGARGAGEGPSTARMRRIRW